jgi:hypothetical protein
MSPQSVVLTVTAGVVLTAAIVALGLILFPSQRDDLLMNLTSEAAGVVAGGLVLFALVEAYVKFRKRREWLRVREELFERIYWELEVLQFAVRPMASWHIGSTLGEELRMLIQTGPGDDQPLLADYFIRLVKTLRGPLDSLNNNVTPRIIALADDEDLTRRLLDLEKGGLRCLVATHSLSEESPESPFFSRLINELLERAAAVGDCVDERQFGNDLQRAAQARFNRLKDFPLGSSSSSGDRQMRLSDGSLYGPGRPAQVTSRLRQATSYDSSRPSEVHWTL